MLYVEGKKWQERKGSFLWFPCIKSDISALKTGFKVKLKYMYLRGNFSLFVNVYSESPVDCVICETAVACKSYKDFHQLSECQFKTLQSVQNVYCMCNYLWVKPKGCSEENIGDLNGRCAITNRSVSNSNREGIDICKDCLVFL